MSARVYDLDTARRKVNAGLSLATAVNAAQDVDGVPVQKSFDLETTDKHVRPVGPTVARPQETTPLEGLDMAP